MAYIWYFSIYIYKQYGKNIFGIILKYRRCLSETPPMYPCLLLTFLFQMDIPPVITINTETLSSLHFKIKI